MILKFSNKKPEYFIEVAKGILKVENVSSPVLVKLLLQDDRTHYISEQVRQRVLVATIHDSSLVKKLNLDDLIYTLGEPEKTPNYNNYFVEIKIFANNESEVSVSM